jgi:hypothetical protein
MQRLQSTQRKAGRGRAKEGQGKGRAAKRENGQEEDRQVEDGQEGAGQDKGKSRIGQMRRDGQEERTRWAGQAEVGTADEWDRGGMK